MNADELIEWFSQQRVSVDLTDVDIDLLRKYTNNTATYVEIGTKYGGSALTVSSTELPPFIDTYDIVDYPECERFISREEFIIKNGLRSMIDFHLEKSPESAKKYPHEFIDVLFIDGAHDYTSVLEDFVGWSGFLIHGSIIIFHDYAPHSPGVIKVCDTFVAGSKFFDVLRTPSLDKEETSSMFIARVK